MAWHRCGTSSCPAGSCPPVIATTPLYSTLNVIVTPADTAARTARLPEWKNVPSPTFCTKCGTSVNAARPIHCAPSPPIWL